MQYLADQMAFECSPPDRILYYYMWGILGGELVATAGKSQGNVRGRFHLRGRFQWRTDQRRRGGVYMDETT